MSGDKKAATDNSPEAKEEAELLASLKRLNDAHNQLRAARGTIAQLLKPMHTQTADPELVYSAFATSAQKAVGDVKDLQTAMRDKKMQELLKKSKEAIKRESSGGDVQNWLAGLNPPNGDWMVDEAAGAATNGLDKLKIEKQPTPKKS